MKANFRKAKVVLCLAVCLLSTLGRTEMLVAYYRFGDDGSFLGDSSGNGNRLFQVVTETPAERKELAGDFPLVVPQTGQENVYSARFSGGSGDVRVLKSAEGSAFHADQFTIEAYIQPDQVSGQHVIASHWDEGIGTSERAWRLLLREADQSLVFQISQDGITPATVVLPVGELSGGRAYYVGASVDAGAEGADIALYFQDRSASEQMLTLRHTLQSVTALHRSSAPLLLGANLSGGDLRLDMLFPGAMDEVRFSGTALPAHRLLAVSPSSGFSFFLRGTPVLQEPVGPVFHVSPEGDDVADGLSLDRPFRTLERARDAVREALNEGETQTMTVRLRGGRYALEKPLVFGLDDGAHAAGQQIVYEAVEGETPVLTSLMPIEGWELVATLPEHVPPEAEGKLYRADVGAIADVRRKAIAEGHSALWDWRIKILYRAGTQVPRAKGDRFDPEIMSNPPRDFGGGRNKILAWPEGALWAHADVQSAELHIIPRFDWSMNILPIETVNETERTAQLAVPGTYTLGVTSKWKLRPCAWVENVPWGMKPGHWLLDSMDEVVYYWSEDGSPPEGIGASNGLLEYIRVEGEIDYEGPEDIPIRGLVFRGLTFTEGARYTFAPDYKGGRWQHDWEGYDEASALLRFRSAEECVVEQCRFVNSGATGVRLDLHAQNITIRENEFGHLGQAGVVLSGYGPGIKNVNRGNTVENNWFHHGAERHWHASAIFIVQSGNNRIRNNRIHDYPYNGITVSGLRRLLVNANMTQQIAESQRTVRWHEIDGNNDLFFPETIPYMHAAGNRIESNELFRVVERLGDGTPIYLSCSGLGNHVFNNYIHHVRGDAASALRSDDSQWGVTYENNVIYKTTGHGIILKGPNRAVNNYLINQKGHFIDHTVPESIFIALRDDPAEGMEVFQNILAQFEGRDPLYYHLNVPSGDVSGANVNDNLIWWEADSEGAELIRSEMEDRHGFDSRTMVADPLFNDVEGRDFGLQSGSPAISFGIAPVDISRVGLTGSLRDGAHAFSETIPAISPRSRIFTGPVTVSIDGFGSGVVIRYTLDGTKPVEGSAYYEGPFVLNHPATVRARAFDDGVASIRDDRVDFYPSTQPVYEPFEKDAEGRTRTRARFWGVTQTSTIQLAEKPGAEGNAVRFEKDPGDSGRLSLIYQVIHGADVEISFELYLYPGAQPEIRWTDARSLPFARKPGLRIEADGTVVSAIDGKELATVSAQGWNTFVLRLPLGDAEPGRQPVLEINGTPVAGFASSDAATRFLYIEQLGFYSSTGGSDVFYLDQIRIAPTTGE